MARILCLEGITGAGKSTQAILLSKYFDSKNVNYLIVTDKHYEPFRQAVIDWHNSGANQNFSRADILKFTKARAESHKRNFSPIINDLSYLVFDRCVFTSGVYEADGGISPEEIIELNLREGVIKPEEGVVLLCSPEVARARIDERRQNTKYTLPSMHESIEEITKRRNLYLQLIKDHPELYLIDTTNRTKEDVFEEVKSRLMV
jgi:dTMP kinase